MFFNVISFILCIYAVISPFIYIKCIKFGYRMNVSPDEESKQPIIKKKQKPIALSEEDEKDIAYMKNIMNYVGDESGQVKF